MVACNNGNLSIDRLGDKADAPHPVIQGRKHSPDEAERKTEDGLRRGGRRKGGAFPLMDEAKEIY